MLDLKITGGTIVDGTGRKGFEGSVGVRDGRIVAVGEVAEEARRTIDATGLVVAPGFIDAHTHYDPQCFWDPDLTPSCYHGVTTVLAGNCGFSIAPLSRESAGYLLPMLARVEGMPKETLSAALPWDWSSFGEFLDRLDGTLGINAGFMVGHSAVRRLVMGPRAVGETATAEDIAQMKGEVAQALAAGALGFSTSTAPSHNDGDGRPVPSRHASREEILELGSVVKDFEGTSLELLPDLAFRQETVDLLVDFSLAGQRPVNWNLLVVTGLADDDMARIDRQLGVGREAARRGAKVVALTLPEGATVRINLISGFVFDSLPGWAELFQMPLEARMERLRDPAYRQVLREGADSATEQMRNFTQWGKLVIAEARSPQYARFSGRTVGEAAAELGIDPLDAMLDIALADDLATSFRMDGFETDEAYVLRGKLMQDEFALIGGSDAGAHMDMIDTYAFSTKVLEKCRTHGLMPLEQVVHRITQRIAHHFGLRDRGELREGAHADVVVFDPARVACGPAYMRYDLPGTTEHGRLYSDAIGIEAVVVNGELFIEGGTIVGERKGTVLRSGRDSYTPELTPMREAAE